MFEKQQQLQTIELAEAIAAKLNGCFEEILDVKEVCALLHLDPPTIYALTSKRLIPHTKPTGKLLFLKSEIIFWLKENRVKTVTDIKIQIPNR